MSRYSIEGSTLTAIGDAVREKTGNLTKEGYVDSHIMDIEFPYSNLSVYYQFPPGTKSAKIRKIFTSDRIWIYLCDSNKNTITVGNKYIQWMLFDSDEDTKENVIQDGYYVQFKHNEAGSYEGQFEITSYDADGNVIQVEGLVKNTLTPAQMAVAIEGLPSSPPEEAFIVSGNCDYRFAYSGWDWFINLYSNKITTSNINSCRNMFADSNLSEIPFALNVRPVRTTDSIYFTYLFQSSKIKKAPYIYVSGVATPTTAGRSIGMDYMFAGCYYLKEIPYDFFNVMITDNDNFWDAVKNHGPNRNNIFANCYSLRELPDITNLNHKQEATYYYSYALYNNMLNGCASLNEVRNIPVADVSVSTSNCFSYCFDKCYRVKNITFATNEDGTPIAYAWKNQTIDLSKGSYNALGFCGGGSTYESYITGYNSGITKDKKVTDDVSYEALKNDPDWYSVSSDYGRYNHDSAVTTINSLPDVSAGSGNTIKFLGAAGAKTDGGAINTLTEEEIAVAAAKGWTVTLA
jgi:hypothetical protein